MHQTLWIRRRHYFSLQEDKSKLHRQLSISGDPSCLLYEFVRQLCGFTSACHLSVFFFVGGGGGGGGGGSSTKKRCPPNF